MKRTPQQLAARHPWEGFHFQPVVYAERAKQPTPQRENANRLMAPATPITAKSRG